MRIFYVKNHAKFLNKNTRPHNDDTVFEYDCEK